MSDEEGHGERGYVDRKRKMLFGYVVAQTGEIKGMDPPARFNRDCLERIIELWPIKGLRSRFHHPSFFKGRDGLGYFLGRLFKPRIVGTKLIADLMLDPTSFKTPNGNLGEYVMKLAETDPDAISSSMALSADYMRETDSSGNLLRDEEGNLLSELMIPTALRASDVVEEGAAVDGLLSKPIPISTMLRELKLMGLKYPPGFV